MGLSQTDIFLQTGSLKLGPRCGCSKYGDSDKAVKIAFEDIKTALKGFNEADGVIEIRHLVSHKGIPFFELKQDKKKCFIESPLTIQQTGIGWSDISWAKCYAAQYTHTAEMDALTELLKTIPNVHFNNERMNVLYYTYIRLPLINISFLNHSDNKEDCIKRLRSATAFSNDNIKRVATDGSELVFTQNADIETFNIFQEKEMYLSNFLWAERLVEDGQGWFSIYNEDAGKELLNLLKINEMVETCKYYFRGSYTKEVVPLTFRTANTSYNYDISILPENDSVKELLDVTFEAPGKAKEIYDSLFYTVLTDWVKEYGLEKYLLPSTEGQET